MPYGQGRGSGFGSGRGRGGGGGGRFNDGFGGMGAGGRCICPRCGHLEPHGSGIPCREMRCPECGARMVREGSYHHKQIEAVKAKKKGGE